MSTADLPAELLDLMAMSAEELDPELAPYLYEDETFGICLKHPLVFQLMFHSPGMANRVFHKKQEALAVAIEEENWSSVIWLHERAYRCDALMDYVIGRDEDGVPLSLDHFDQETRDLIADVWTDSENIGQHEDDWRAIFAVPEGFWLGSQGERDEFDALPDPIPVWRGDIEDGGWSFTTDERVARFFADRFPHLGTYDIVQDTIPKDRVFGYLSRRGESEVLVRP
jgi:hypothetical protein